MLHSVDIAFLSTHFSFYSMLKLYERKFSDSNIIRPMKSITYFDDVDFEEDVIMLNGKYDWRLIEERLVDMVKKQTKIYKTFPLF